MKNILEDVLYCLKLSLYFFAAPFALGIIIGLISHGFNLNEVLLWGCRVTELVSALGLGIAGISFIKRDLMRPLDYEKVWRTYFHRLNLSHVIFMISVFVAAFAYTIDYFVRPIA
ncbi:hypothetical protein NBE98_22190 [Clostridium swellfunianum]|uniref:hypothetical protein n=1 Tax=Clostridium swellfunianum TaxID=1367462 RepID=UPI00202E0677|nr:hypothetical protein [Clostridium swellfunianum]MCM0651072.1 hypothetical protein [Clostridium swellfunianum]